jgi:taurine dioxygenase
MQVERFAAPLGAVVTGVDVTTVDRTTWETLDALFVEHHVLAFRDQELTPDEQLTFARLWGPLVRHPYAGMDNHPEMIELVNEGRERDLNQHWHSDMTYEAAPPKLTMLYARSTPSIGGDTAFANQQLAYEDLSDGLRSMLDQLYAVHSGEAVARAHTANEAEAPRAVHPVVRTHDQSGQKSLFVCKLFTQFIVGWSAAESRPLLDYLFAHSVRPEYQARHQWRRGDLVLWDNRCLLHFAVHDHGDAARIIHRCQVVGPQPS